MLGNTRAVECRLLYGAHSWNVWLWLWLYCISKHDRRRIYARRSKNRSPFGLEAKVDERERVKNFYFAFNAHTSSSYAFA